MSDEEKKIIIDEDWKTEVLSEREELQREKQASEVADTPPEGFATPPASFEMLLSTMVTEAMVALGRVPHPATGETETNLEQAGYFIDTIEMLEEKTRGNLTDQEAEGLSELLHQVRMLYVSVKSEEK